MTLDTGYIVYIYGKTRCDIATSTLIDETWLSYTAIQRVFFLKINRTFFFFAKIITRLFEDDS